MKKCLATTVFLGFLVVLGLFVSVPSLLALTIDGTVKKPLDLTTDDLTKFESVSVRLNEIKRDNTYHGVFTYRGVPLRSLLELAAIQKTGPGFNRPLDLAVVVYGKGGKMATLSWGEIFYRNPSDVIVALAATPVMPHHGNCGDCHAPTFFEPVLNLLKRKVGFPKLVVTNDFFTDRSIEDVVRVEVVDLKKYREKKKMNPLFSPKFILPDGQGKTMEIADLAAYPHIEVDAKDVGDGRGYHGWKRFGGVSLRALMKNANVGQNMNTGILVSSVDGYQILLSYGEVFLAPGGERIILADHTGKTPLKDGGKFCLIIPDDVAADREVKAVDRIEIIDFGVSGKNAKETGK